MVTEYYFYQVFCYIGCLPTLIVSQRAVLTVGGTFHAEPGIRNNVLALDVRHPDVYQINPPAPLRSLPAQRNRNVNYDKLTMR